jgi:tRNA (guanine-N7-)-methyltransferase
MTDTGDGRDRPSYAELAPRPLAGSLDLRELAAVGGRVESELEIGFGRGLFLLERGRLCPRTSLLGIESKTKWAVRVGERCRKQGLDNVTVWAGDARDLLGRMGPDGVLKRVFVHFPDPWWKKRHAKRRLLDPVLLSELARLLVSGGELFVQTDVRERAASIVELLRSRVDFRLTGDDGLIAANPYGARSNRERRVEADGLPVYRILALRG